MQEIKAGDEISRDWWPPAVMANDATNISNITSTTAIVGSPEVGTTFVAPTSGRVGVCLQAGITQDDATNRIFVTFMIYEGTSTSGTLVLDARAQFGVGSTGHAVSEEMVEGNMTMIENLTPGATHYAVVVYWVAGGTTNDITHRRVIVFPLP